MHAQLRFSQGVVNSCRTLAALYASCIYIRLIPVCRAVFTHSSSLIFIAFCRTFDDTLSVPHYPILQNVLCVFRYSILYAVHVNCSSFSLCTRYFSISDVGKDVKILTENDCSFPILRHISYLNCECEIRNKNTRIANGFDRS